MVGEEPFGVILADDLCIADVGDGRHVADGQTVQQFLLQHRGHRRSSAKTRSTVTVVKGESDQRRYSKLSTWWKNRSPKKRLPTWRLSAVAYRPPDIFSTFSKTPNRCQRRNPDYRRLAQAVPGWLLYWRTNSAAITS